MRRWLSLLLLCLAALAVGAPARAAGQLDDPSFTITADTDTLELGGRLDLRAQIVSSIETPQQPQLAVAHGVTVERTLTGQTEIVSITNGVAVQKHGLSVTWVLRGTALGSTSVTPSVVVAGVRHAAKPVRLSVVGAGSLPHRQQQPQQQRTPQNPFGGFPFGGFGGFDPFRDLFGTPDETPEVAQEPATDPKLSFDVAPAPHTFVRATVDKTSAVVGEQIILAIDRYVETGFDPEFTDTHEAVTSDFIRHSLMADDTKAEPLGMAKVGGSIWAVLRIRKAALFPLKAGDLRIEPMQETIAGRRSGGVRATEPITIRVSEPPAAGRPAGYALGDVGRFTLSADVSPRRVKRGDVVSVTVDLNGIGNLPDRLAVPARAGVEWLEPEVHEKAGRVDADHWGGTRTTTWVVRMLSEGTVDLGEIALPHWDPQRKAYETARATLGAIEVLPGSAPAPSASAKLPGLPEARAGLARPGVRAHTDDAPWFWAFLAAPALVVLSATGARAAGKRLAARAAEKSASPERELDRRVREAASACEGTDARKADAAIVRALEQATIARRGVNVRGSTRASAKERLVEAGVKDAIAADLLALLAECEDARFSPDGAKADAARARWKRARAVLEDL